MDSRIQIVAILAAAAMLFGVLELVRQRRLLERYALGWMFAAVVFLILAVWRGALEKLAGLVGIATPSNALFFVAVGAILLLLLHFSVAVSRLQDQTKVLAQRLALVEERLRGVTGEDEAGEPAAEERRVPTPTA
jgi:hypothetical protein